MTNNAMTSRNARRNIIGWARGIDIGNDSTLTEFFLGKAPANTRLVVDSIEYVHTVEAASNEPATVKIGHHDGSSLDDDSIGQFTTVAAAARYSTGSATLASTLATRKEWPRRPVIPAGRPFFATLTKMASLNDGVIEIIVWGWEFDELNQDQFN